MLLVKLKKVYGILKVEFTHLVFIDTLSIAFVWYDNSSLKKKYLKKFGINMNFGFVFIQSFAFFKVLLQNHTEYQNIS
jgi:hypothetical protein